MIGQHEALELFNDNAKLVTWTIDRYYPTYRFDEDLRQEAYLGLWKACTSYKSDVSKFSTYAVKCIFNEIGSRLQTANRRKKVVMLSMETPVYNDVDGSRLTIADTLIDNGSYVDDQGTDIGEFVSQLEGMDKQLVRLSLLGFTQQEMADRLGTSQAVCSRHLKSLLKKYKRKYN